MAEQKQDEDVSSKTEKAPEAQAAGKQSGEQASEQTGEQAGEQNGRRGGRRATMDISFDSVRTRVAQVVWLVCVLCALVLALGALTYALKMNTDNSLVEFAREWAGRVDLGTFSIDNGLKQFDGDNGVIKNALFNWGIGAVAWLIIGKVLDKVIRP